MRDRNDKLNDEFGRISAVRRLDIFDTPQEAVFEHITKLVKISLRVPMSAVSLIDTDRQWFKSVQGMETCEIPREHSFCTVTIAQRRPMIVEDTHQDPRFASTPLVTGTPFIRSYAGAPLMLPDGYQAGALCAMDTVPRHFSASEIDVLVHLSACVVNEIELRQRASRDNLTGFMLRYPFLTRLRAMFEEYQRRRTPATLAILDLDHFKAVNDRFGHDAGDAVLGDVADCCRAVSTGDVQFGRLGGEEFALSFPAMGTDAALPQLERLRAALEGLTFPGYPGLRVTGSFGVSSLHPGVASVSAWCKMADAALYSAKQAGRNRVTICNDPRALLAATEEDFVPRLPAVEPADVRRFADMMLWRGAA